MRLRILILVLTALVATACGTKSAQPTRTTRTNESLPARDEPAKATAQAPVNAERRAGDLIMTKFLGSVPSVEELAALRTRRLGGVILFGWNVQDATQLRAFTKQLQDARPGGSPVLISVDQEGGAIRNVPFAPPEHTQPEIAADRLIDPRNVGTATADGLRDVGVNMDLGPVADLASPPNRTMAGRAFGSDPEQVAPLVGQTVAGMAAGRIASTPKHFPGFGASTQNSDNGIAYVDRTLEQLRGSELLPFESAVSYGASVIMVSHGILRGEGRTLPGTVDPYVATKLLRGELHFAGVAMTDSMNAKGFRDAWGKTVPQACPAAIAAGIDLVLLTGSLETATLCRTRILAALADGSLPRDRFEQAVCRVDVLRRALRSGHMTDVSFSSCGAGADPSPAATAERPAT
jgi:beta-N-acetylhexosaminidase